MFPESPDQRFAKTLIARVAATDARGSNAASLAIANISSPPVAHLRETGEAHEKMGDKIVLFEGKLCPKQKVHVLYHILQYIDRLREKE